MRPSFWIVMPTALIIGLGSAYAHNDADVLQQWKDYVKAYEEYMEKYTEWSENRFAEYEDTIKTQRDLINKYENTIKELKNDMTILDDINSEVENDKKQSTSNIKTALKQKTELRSIPLDPIVGNKFSRTSDGLTLETYPKQHIYGIGDTINTEATLDLTMIEIKHPKRYDLGGRVLPLDIVFLIQAPHVNVYCKFDYDYTEIIFDSYCPRGKDLFTIDGRMITVMNGSQVMDHFTAGIHKIRTFSSIDGSRLAEINEVIEIGNTSNPPTITRVSILDGAHVEPNCWAVNKCSILDDASINVGDTIVWYDDDESYTNSATNTFSLPHYISVYDKSKLLSNSHLTSGSWHYTFDEAGEYRIKGSDPWIKSVVTVS